MRTRLEGLLNRFMSALQIVYIETNGGTESIYCENIEDNVFRCEESSLNNELITIYQTN